MATTPSVKGAVLALEIEQVSKLVSEGEISREELGRRLPAEDLALFDRTVFASGWYDIRIFTRLLELSRDVAGEGRNDFLVRHGALLIERMIGSHLYQQLEHLRNMQVGKASERRERFLAFGRDLKRLTTLSASVYNFSQWNSVVDRDHPDRHVIEISDAAPFPDAWLWMNQGAINRMAQEHGAPDLWRWERPRPDLIHYRMTRAL